MRASTGAGKPKKTVRSPRAVEGSKTYTKRGANKMADKNAPLRKNTRLQKAYTEGKKMTAAGGMKNFGRVNDALRSAQRIIDNPRDYGFKSSDDARKGMYQVMMKESKKAAIGAKTLKKVNAGPEQARLSGAYRKAASQISRYAK